MTEEVLSNYLLRYREDVLAYSQKYHFDASEFFRSYKSEALRELVISYYYPDLGYLRRANHIDDIIWFLTYASKENTVLFLNKLTENEKLTIQSVACQYIIKAIRLKKLIKWNEDISKDLATIFEKWEREVLIQMSIWKSKQ